MLPTEGELVVKKVLNGLMVLLALILVFAGFISYRIKGPVIVYLMAIGGIVFIFYRMYEAVTGDKYKTKVLIVVNELTALVALIIWFYLYCTVPMEQNIISIKEYFELYSISLWLKFVFIATSLMDVVLRLECFERKADEIEF